MTEGKTLFLNTSDKGLKFQVLTKQVKTEVMLGRQVRGPTGLLGGLLIPSRTTESVWKLGKTEKL